MESNRGSAEVCVNLALKAIVDRNYEKAEKLLLKAEKMFPSQKAKELLTYLSTINGTQPPETCKQRKSKFQTGGNETEGDVKKTEITYTADQMEIVKKIKPLRGHYEILGVTKEATACEIKRAYKKLALQLHPDKNRAPGATEQFRKVNIAASILTDDIKRKEYDTCSVFDNQCPYSGSSQYYSRSNSEYSEQHSFDTGDISPEEFFNIFLGGFTSRRNPRYSARRHDENKQPSLVFGLIIILILISMLTSFFSSDPVYSLAYSNKYSVLRHTENLGVPYYVKQGFGDEYRGSFVRLEHAVEEDYIITMKHHCFRERTYRESLMARARNIGSRSQYTQAESLKAPSCDKLVKIGLTQYEFYPFSQPYKHQTRK